jgi:predicted phosphodiesterase
VSVNVRADVCREYIAKNKGLSKKKLSELLSYKYPELGSIEQFRSSIRVLTGSHGDVKRKDIKNKAEWITIPEPEVEDYTKVEISDKRIGILSDIHLPYYDKKALVASVNSIKNFDASTVILNGDIIDCYQLSNFDKDPRNRSFKYELDMLKNFFEDLRKAFPKARIIYKIGNHEERYERIILQRIPQLIDLDLVNFENVVKAREFGIEVVKNKRVIKIGKLNVIHGHEIRAGIISPVNIARGFFLKTKASTLGGHHHRTSEHIEHDLNGDFIGCFSTGCLCGLTPSYMPINSFNHGFALVENFGEEFHVRNLKIINGKVL